MSMKSVPKVEKPEIIEAIGASGALGSSKNRQALFAYLLDAHFKGGAGALTTRQIAIDVLDGTRHSVLKMTVLFALKCIVCETL